MLSRVPWILACLVFLSCAQRAQQTPRPIEPRTTVRVTNRQFTDMKIYLIHNLQRIRLGTARGGSSTVFVIPADLVASTMVIRFLAVPMAGGESQTDEFPIRAGEEVTIFIPPS